MTRNYLLLLSAIFALFLCGCSTLPGNVAPTYTIPAVTDTPVAATTNTPVASLTDTPVPSIAGKSWPTVLPSTAKFDYYVLALSWAPNYCSTNSGDAQECSLGKKYAFVLHGLWPQNNKGYPSNCSNDSIPASVMDQFQNLYPNDTLFGHEWISHGTCSGLSPVDYLTLTSELKAHLQIPAAYRAPANPFRVTADSLKQAFLRSNRTLTAASLAVNCSGSGRYLSELYVCFSKDGQPAACGADVNKDALKSCSSTNFTVRSVR